MLQVIDPTTGSLVYERPAMSQAEWEQAVARSQKAFTQWKNITITDRSGVLNRVADVMRENEEHLAGLMTQEMGKPIKEARGEVQKSIWCAEHYANCAEEYLKSVTLQSDATHSYIQHLPLGPVLGILPWNAPFWLAFRFCAPALMAGNTCLMKHDPHVPDCAAAIAELFIKAGAPADIMLNLPLATEQVSSVIEHPAVRAVSFTGSSHAGSQVAALASAQIKPIVMELGGSDPVIVLADAELNQAADTIALSRMINAGQSCIAAKRIIVEEAVYEPFIERLHERLATLQMGDPREESTDIGPIARDDLRANLARQVDETIAQGARCLLGGELPDGEGFFYPVTLLVDVTNDMVACREETFGPVAVVLKAKDVNEAIAMANDSEYGLAASIWTQVERGEVLASQLEAGQVAVNGIVKTDPRLPSGGIKRSGLGRELGPHGILEFVNVQQIWVGPKQD